METYTSVGKIKPGAEIGPKKTEDQLVSKSQISKPKPDMATTLHLAIIGEALTKIAAELKRYNDREERINQTYAPLNLRDLEGI